MTGELTEIPLTSDRWDWGTAQPAFVDHLGRPAARFPDAFELATLDGVRLSDGIVELDLAVTRQRSFPGVAWHVADARNQETFFVRPHQVGNPDAIQYTPVTNGISSWQLYHGPGFWAPIVFPIGDWFTIRVAFAGRRATAHVADLTAPALVIDEQKLAAASGGIGLLVAGPGLHVARFAYADATPTLPEPMSPPRDPTSGIIPSWWVSEPFEEARLNEQLAAEHRWTRLAAQPSGLADLARASGLEGERNTVLARATLSAAWDGLVPLEIGFSDRAVVFLDGRPLFRGDDAYRTRDYRFLGSIGWWDTVYLPLREGANELVVAVSETFGGWGLQARLPEDSGVVVRDSVTHRGHTDGPTSPPGPAGRVPASPPSLHRTAEVVMTTARPRMEQPRRESRVEQVIQTLADGLGNGVGWLASTGILFGVFALLWLGFAGALLLSQGSIDAAWQWVNDLPLVVRLIAWLLFLPVMAGMWIWETTWPVVVRLVLVAGVAGWNLLVLLPRAVAR